MSATIAPNTKQTTFPPSFRHVRLELAREKGHPDGDAHFGYDILMPLAEDGHIDAAEWKTHQALCRVRRFHEGEDDRVGRLRRKPGGTWFFDYDGNSRADDEAGFRFGEERFVPGEYVSLHSEKALHTFQVKRVAPL